MVKRAEELAKKHGWFLAQQFENPANPEYHRNTTGPGDPARLRRQASRLLRHRLRHGRHHHRRGPDAEEGAAGRQDRRRRARGRGDGHQGEWQPHKIQGWTPDFVPAVLDRKVYDESCTVTDVEARDAARDLATKEGIFCGISSGGTFAAAQKVAKARRAGLRPSRDAAGHGRALPVDDPLRGDQRGNGHGLDHKLLFCAMVEMMVHPERGSPRLGTHQYNLRRRRLWL